MLNGGHVSILVMSLVDLSLTRLQTLHNMEIYVKNKTILRLGESNYEELLRKNAKILMTAKKFAKKLFRDNGILKSLL